MPKIEWANKHNAVEVLQALYPPTNLKDLGLEGYPCEYLPSWFHPLKMPKLASLQFGICNGFESISFPNNNGRLGGIIFSSIEHITIKGCQNLSSLEHCLHPSYVPAVRKIVIADCKRLVSLPIERFGDFHRLQELKVSNCRRPSRLLSWQERGISDTVLSPALSPTCIFHLHV